MTTPYRREAEVEQETPQSFPLEKILTASAKDYCDSVGKKLSDYKLEGIHVHLNESKYRSLSESFRERIPKGTEIVVNYQAAYVGFNSSVEASGTALIPKPKEAVSPAPIMPNRLIGDTP